MSPTLHDLRFLTNIPVVGPLFRILWRRYSYYRQCLVWWMNSRRNQGPAPIDPFKIYWVPTSIVTQDARSESSRVFGFQHTGCVIGGGWDLEPKHVTEHALWDGLHERYEEKIPWRKTDYFQNQLLRIKNGETAMGCSTEKQLHKQYKHIDDVYWSMLEDGYCSQWEIIGNRTKDALQEIPVHVGRDGTLQRRGGGNHRIRLAHFLNLDKIAVRIVVRHEQWQKKRNRIATGDSDPHELGLDPNHPDLLDI